MSGPPFINHDAMQRAQSAQQAAALAGDHQAWLTAQQSGGPGNPTGPWKDPMAGLPEISDVIAALVKAGSPNSRPLYGQTTVKGRLGRSSTTTVEVGRVWPLGRSQISRNWRHSWGSDWGTEEVDVWINQKGQYGFTFGDITDILDEDDLEYGFRIQAVKDLCQIAASHGVPVE